MGTPRAFSHASGQSDKLSILNDLEFRCWIQCLLSADDFGVLPLSSALLRDDNLALAASCAPVIDRALHVIVQVELFVRFEHRGTPFIVHPFWQDVQRILFPRATSYPAPPQDVLSRLSRATKLLFLAHHPGYRAGNEVATRFHRRAQPRSRFIPKNPPPQRSRPIEARARPWHSARLRGTGRRARYV